MTGEQSGDQDHPSLRPACPACLHVLLDDDQNPSCSSCGAEYGRLPSGHLRLLPRGESGFQDWWLENEKTQARFM